MQLPSDTPPDGDFARYIEQLDVQAAARALNKAGHPAPPHARHQERVDSRTERSSPPTQGKEAINPELPRPLAGISLWSVGKWVLVAWIGLEVLSAMFPRAGMLILPLLMVFAAWAFYRFKKYSPELLKARLRELAEQAAKELKQRK